MAILLRDLNIVNRHDALNGGVSKPRPSRIGFLHSAFCQVGLPRSPTTERTFERRNGRIRVRMNAGDARPLPFGIIPRLLLTHLSTEAVRRKSADVIVDRALYDLLSELGMPCGGGPRGGYAVLRRQLDSLAACQFVIDAQINEVERIEGVLLSIDAGEEEGDVSISLHPTYVASLLRHAVPLDLDVAHALRHSALAFDLYVWLMQRHVRVLGRDGLKLSWRNLREQFGQEYGDARNFKRAFLRAIEQLDMIDSATPIERVAGGIAIA